MYSTLYKLKMAAVKWHILVLSKQNCLFFHRRHCIKKKKIEMSKTDGLTRRQPDRRIFMYLL